MQRILVGLALLLVVAGCDRGSQGGRVLTGARRGLTTTLPVRPPPLLACHRAPPTRFQWYANGVQPGVQLNESARDRSTLLGYLQQRQAMREHMVVEAVDFNGYRDADRTAHFEMLLRRAADDIPGGPVVAGQGRGRLRYRKANGHLDRGAMTGLGRLGRIGSVAVTATAARLRVGATGRVLVQAVTSAGQYISYPRRKPDAGPAGGRLRTHGVGPCQGARKDRPVSGPVADG